ncbi:MAG TPA: Holliday junction resolvase RuvX [Bacteroidia bacterium]|jgi:putative Holliday junction resolvase|nr:Holliday junction resolvase RuvX [Bacteroidia bacterium]HQF27613.1 Holliday junction resolvase RuvX [Bacteroidia bacterium]HQK96877.1 Holliday junction resolvase RuvX [Bacteroidia bacterium]
MARIMAIDFGSKRTGLAVTDPSQIIATALETVPTHQLFDYLKNYISKENVECIVVGDPRRLNNEMSETTHLTNQFVNKLKREIPGIPVKRLDERYTSVMAAKSLIESGQSRKTRQDKSVLDKISATILLQNYLSTLPPKNL